MWLGWAKEMSLFQLKGLNNVGGYREIRRRRTREEWAMFNLNLSYGLTLEETSRKRVQGQQRLRCISCEC